jgi:hypothetical protein
LPPPGAHLAADALFCIATTHGNWKREMVLTRWTKRRPVVGGALAIWLFLFSLSHEVGIISMTNHAYMMTGNICLRKSMLCKLAHLTGAATGGTGGAQRLMTIHDVHFAASGAAPIVT